MLKVQHVRGDWYLQSCQVDDECTVDDGVSGEPSWGVVPRLVVHEGVQDAAPDEDCDAQQQVNGIQGHVDLCGPPVQSWGYSHGEWDG